MRASLVAGLYSDRRWNRPAAQEKLPDPFDVEGLVRERRLGELLVIGPEAIGDLDRTHLVLVGSEICAGVLRMGFGGNKGTRLLRKR